MAGWYSAVRHGPHESFVVSAGVPRHRPRSAWSPPVPPHGRTLFTFAFDCIRMPDSDDDLRDALTDIHGIGDAKAAEILDVVDAGGVPDAVADNVRQAADYHDAGDHAYASKFVRRAADALSERETLAEEASDVREADSDDLTPLDGE